MATTTNALGFPLLTVILFLPAVAGTICMFVEEVRITRIIATAAVAVDFLLAAFLLVKFEILPGGVTLAGLTHGQGWTFQFADRHDWIPNLGINYWVGVDGVSIWLVALATLMMTIAILASHFMITERARSFLVFMLFLETGLLGVFTSLNVFLFFVFWEAMLIPSYFLLGIWGEQRREYATTKFVIYTVFGSFLMLVGVFYLWAQNGTLDMPGPQGLIAHPVSTSAQIWLFLAFTLAFGIKLPLWPFHTWAPTAYSEAPIPFLIALAGIMSKAGGFGLLRYCLPLFPYATHQLAPLVSVLAIIGILYAGLIALVQTDVKRIVAYSSVSHMNLIALGIFSLNATGFDGSVLQMINHGVIISGLFLFVAYIAARTGTRSLRDMGGLGERWPVLMWVFFVFILAGLDLPGLSSFAGEFLILLGMFRTNAWFSAIAALTVILAAWYMIRMFQDTMNGPVTAAAEEESIAAEDGAQTPYQFPVARRLPAVDLRWREVALVVPLIALILYIGVQPDRLTTRMNPTTGAVSFLLHRANSGVSFGGGR